MRAARLWHGGSTHRREPQITRAQPCQSRPSRCAKSASKIALAPGGPLATLETGAPLDLTFGAETEDQISENPSIMRVLLRARQDSNL